MDPVESFFAELVVEDPLLAWMDAEVDAAGEEALILRVPESDRIKLSSGLAGTSGTVHAGVIATLIDTTGGAARKQLANGPEAVLATTDLNISYLRPATGGLIATGLPDRVGRSTAVVRVTVESETPRADQDTVAVGRATYRIVRPDE